MTEFADLRKTYSLSALIEEDVDHDPVRQFVAWFDQAIASQVAEPNAMTLATVDADNKPSARIVLVKGVDARGFTFFTNYQSRKGRELAENPAASLLFWWTELERQVRIEGVISKVDALESDAYYASRPLDSRLGAWASDQSAVVPDRREMERREAQFRQKFGDSPPRPPHWGGYRLRPDVFEFWQGRPSRLHDRIRYVREADEVWRIERLFP
ncbi:MAG: pyridoxamine 5'-phosphate oxidase [Janthinobacterium lividum]